MSTAQQQAVAKEATTHKVLGRLPAGWRFVEFGEMVDRSRTKYDPSITNTFLPVVELEHIEPHTGRLLGCSTDNSKTSVKSPFGPGQVLFGKLRPYLRKFHRPDFHGACSTEIWVLDGKKGLCDNEYLFQLVQTHQFLGACLKTTGSKMPRADWDLLGSIAFPLPPLPEQQRIARILGTWDKAIGLLQEQIAAKELRLRGLIDQLVSGQRHGAKDGKLPKGWRWVRLGEVFEFLSTTSHSRSQLTMEADEGDVHYIHYGDIHATYNTPLLDIQRNVHVPKLRHGISIPRSADFLKDGDLILADASEDVDGIGACVELVNVGGCSAISGLHTLALRDKAGHTISGYRAYLLRSAHAVKRLRQVATGSKVHGVSRSNMAALRVPLPPKEEQQQIAGCVNQAYAELANMNAQLDELHQQKKGLMQELLSGRSALKS